MASRKKLQYFSPHDLGPEAWIERNTSLWIIFLTALLLGSFHDSALSQGSDSSSHLESSSLIAPWGVVQTHMKEKGIIFRTINTLDVFRNTTGGLQKKTAVAGDLDLLLTVDGQRLLKMNNATFFFYGLGVYGKDPSNNVGDAQAVSSIAAVNGWKLFEAWYQQNFWEDRISLLAGLYDVTSEFDVIRSSSELFLNSSFGTGPEFSTSGKRGLSTFPTTSLAIRGQAILSDTLVIRASIADAVPGNPSNPNATEVILKREDGLFIGAELAFYDLKEKKKNTQQGLTQKRPFRLLFQRVGRAAPLGYQGKYAIGVWGHTTDLNDQSQN